MKTKRLIWVLATGTALAVGCGDSGDETVPVGGGGAAGADASAGSGGVQTGGTAGVQTGGTAGVQTGGTAGVQTGGTGGEPPDASAGSGGGVTGGTGGSPPTCTPVGDSCSGNAECCSQACDPTAGICLRNPLACASAGASCGDNTECCSLNCVNGACRAQACIEDGEACTPTGNACCSGMCEGGTCVDINGPATCLTAGHSCTDGTECCSGYCPNGFCAIGVSHCVQLGDICTANNECCSGVCEKADAADPYGACAEIEVGPAACSTGIAGMICNSCGTCCSRACAPGPVGVFICQLPSGCRPANEICKLDTDCCGGDVNAGLPGSVESNVTCEKETPTDEFGRCKSQSCTPQGDVCQLIGGACSESTSLPSNCCPTNANPSNPLWKKGECEFDNLLIPRCNGLADCVPTGGYCSSSADCCFELPCVPDPNDNNRLKCFIPPDGGDPCVPAGGPCTANADCCPPLDCIIPPGEVFGTCSTDGTGGAGGGGAGGAAGNGGGGSGGTGGSCAQYGQTCQNNTDCCYWEDGVECIGGRCLIQG